VPLQDQIVYRDLGLVDYQTTLKSMQDFTEQRTENTADELWVLQHNPVYTLGRKGNRTNLINVGQVPVVQVDRGGDVTYHGPGQLVVYLLVDIKRIDKSVRELVSAIEASIVEYLANLGITAAARRDAPGVYVAGEKIASLGLRIRRGCSYHGLALNIDMDMTPWRGINACDLGVPITQINDLLDNAPPINTVASELATILAHCIGYKEIVSRAD
jgi:lipoyl(octanoyl) transferase